MLDITLKRAGGLFGVSFALMVALSVAFYAWRPAGAGLNIPWLSVAISLVAVLAPAAVACFWPTAGAPGRLPSFAPVNRWLLAGAIAGALPLYVVFAALQIALGKTLGMHAESNLVEPLTASGPLAFAWIWLAVAFLPAFTEETLYRGMFQSAAMRRWGPLVGLGAASFLFSLAHLEPAGFVSRILMGLWFGWLYWRTGSLLPGAIAHTLNNTCGVILANWGAAIEPHLGGVYAAAALCLALGAACLHRSGVLAPDGALTASEHQMPRIVQVTPPAPELKQP